MLIFIIAPGGAQWKKSSTSTQEQPISAATSLHQLKIQPELEEVCGVDDGGNRGVMGDAVAIGDLACITSCEGGGRGRTPVCV